MTQAVNPYAPPAAQAIVAGNPVSKTALLLLTFFFGGIGAHKFYLGRNWQGALYLVFFWTWIPALIALIEFLVYAFTGAARLKEKYPERGSWAVVGGVIAIFIVLVAGILAGLVIPAHADRVNRMRFVEAISVVPAWRAAVHEHTIDQGKLPDSAAELGKELLPAQADTRYGTVSLGAGGVLTVTLSPATGDMAGKTIVFRPSAAPAGMNWDCTGGTLERRYRTASCRSSQ